MHWNKKLEKIIDYVEQHLQRTEEPVVIEEISKIAGCSYPFFMKVFSYMNGISFSEYIRFRKMTLAGYDLKSTDMKIVDISYKYGYDSPTSFTRAFQQFHGIPPNEARKIDGELQVYPKMHITNKETYTWRIEYKPAFRLTGRDIWVSAEQEIRLKEIPGFWSECHRDGTFLKLASVDEGQQKGLFGVCNGYDKDKQAMNYAIMVCSGQKPDEEFQEIFIPETAWAVFDCYGAMPSGIQKGWQYLQKEWLVKYPFKHAACPELEWYSNGNVFADDYFTQIWIPIIEEA